MSGSVFTVQRSRLKDLGQGAPFIRTLIYGYGTKIVRLKIRRHFGEPVNALGEPNDPNEQLGRCSLETRKMPQMRIRKCLCRCRNYTEERPLRQQQYPHQHRFHCRSG